MPHLASSRRASVLAAPVNDSRQNGEPPRHVLACVPPPQREANRCARRALVQPHRQEHVRRLQATRGASGTGRYRDALEVQAHEDRFAVGAEKAHVERVPKPVLAVSVEATLGDLLDDPLPEELAQPGQRLPPREENLRGQGGRRSETDEATAV